MNCEKSFVIGFELAKKLAMQIVLSDAVNPSYRELTVYEKSYNLTIESTANKIDKLDAKISLQNKNPY